MSDLEAILAEIARVDHDALGLQGQLDAPRGCLITFDEQRARDFSPC